MDKVGVIIVAGGAGSRMGSVTGNSDGALPKQFMMLGGRTVLEWSVDAFRRAVPGAEIVVALPEGFLDFAPEGCRMCVGGATRFHSVRNALAVLGGDREWIAVHDGARPLVSIELIVSVLRVAMEHGSAVPVVPVTDSVRRVDFGDEATVGVVNGEILTGSRPVDRSVLRAVQTPQVFRASVLRGAYGAAGQLIAGDDCPAAEVSAGRGAEFTDDASVVEAAGFGVTLCQGERRNIKITHPDDLVIANLFAYN